VPIKISDRATITDKLQVDENGYLNINARVARTGIQQYLGAELGRPDLGIVNVYRDEAEVFAHDSLNTFSKLPLTDDHPAEFVTAENWRDLARGVTGDEVLRDGEYLKIGLKIADAATVKAIQDGKRELSVGYSAQIEFVDGVAPDGQRYQAVQKDIRANHIAIVSAGRAGSKARIGDAWASPITEPTITQTGGPMADSNMKTIVLGDAAVTVAATDVAAVEKFKQDAAKQLADAVAEKDKAIAAKDAELAKLQAQLDDAKTKILTDAQIDQRVAERADLVAVCARLAPNVKPQGLMRRSRRPLWLRTWEMRRLQTNRRRTLMPASTSSKSPARPLHLSLMPSGRACSKWAMPKNKCTTLTPRALST